MGPVVAVAAAAALAAAPAAVGQEPGAKATVDAPQWRSLAEATKRAERSGKPVMLYVGDDD